MAPKKVARSASADYPEELARAPLQAVLLADSFATKFRPITLERPKVLLPLVNVPMIEYTLAWLESVGVEEVFVFCCAHSNQIKDYLNKSQWTKTPSSFSFSVSTIESHDAISAGDALRVIYNRSVIRGDFILVSGDTVSNMDLTQALEEHKDRRKKDPLAVMTMVIKHAKPSSTTLQTRLGTDESIMGIHPETKELLYYEDKADHLQRVISLNKTLLMENPALRLHNDKQDCFIDICSPEVLSLFTDNFDYQHIRRHFVKGLLVDDIMGYKIFTYETHASYAARVENFRSYDTISKDIIQRWAYPFVPDVQYLGIGYQAKLERQGIYRAPDVILSRSAHIGAFSFVGNGTTIGDHSHISTSVIGQRCAIGKNVVIESSYIWDNVTIEDGCQLSHALVCDGVHLRAGVILEPGVILSFKVEVGQKLVIPAYSKVSVLPQPCKQDSDEELEYADATSGVIESPSITSVANARNQDLMSNMLDEPDADANSVGISGVGYIWSVSEAEHDEEWRFSIAPIPKEKLEKFSHSALDDNDEVNQDESSILTSGELIPDSDGTDFDGGVGEDYRDSADFENEVEATFRRALAGVDVQNVILEISSLRLSYNMSHADCAGALFYAIMKSASDISYSNNTELSANTKMEINKWKNLLKNYIKSQDEEIEVIMKFEEICLDTIRDFRPLFTDILHHLYEEEIITEDAILSWENEKQGADESDKIFVKQAEHFIKWLKEASEEDEDEDDDD